VPRPDAPAPAARSGATLRRAGPGLKSAASSRCPVRTRRRRRRAAAPPSADRCTARMDHPLQNWAGPGLTSAVGLHGAPSGRAGAGGAQRRHPPPGRSRPHIGGQPPRCPVRTRRRRRRAAAPPSAGPVKASHRRSASTVPVRTRRRWRRAAASPSAGPVPASHWRPVSTVPRPDAAGVGGLQRRQAHRQAAHVGVGSPRATRSIRSFESRRFTIRDSDRNASRLEFSEFEIRIFYLSVGLSGRTDPTAPATEPQRRRRPFERGHFGSRYRRRSLRTRRRRREP
jgi:hypothetical protein